MPVIAGTVVLYRPIKHTQKRNLGADGALITPLYKLLRTEFCTSKQLANYSTHIAYNVVNIAYHCTKAMRLKNIVAIKRQREYGANYGNR